MGKEVHQVKRKGTVLYADLPPVYTLYIPNSIDLKYTKQELPKQKKNLTRLQSLGRF